MTKHYRILDHTTGSSPAQEMTRTMLRACAAYLAETGASGSTVAELHSFADGLVPVANPGWRMSKEIVMGLVVDVVVPDEKPLS